MKLHQDTATDGYKPGHGPMYQQGTTEVLANLTPRTDRIYRESRNPVTGEITPNCTSFYDGKLVWVGGQGAVQELFENWEESFFSKPKDKVIGRYKRRLDNYLGRPMPTVDQMAALHDLGYLPLEFRALPEGMLVPMGIPVLTIHNTHKDFAWFVNYNETPVSSLTWKSATNATIAREYRLICEHYLKLTGCYDAFTVSVMCHDFSMRGMSGPEDAARSNFGHLLSFIGTDCLPSMDYAEDYYGFTGKNGEILAISVPATEHAVTSNNILTIEGKILRGEYQCLTMEQWKIQATMAAAGEEVRFIAEVMFVYELITRIVPDGIVSNVSDTYDFWAMVARGYKYLENVIRARKGNGPQPGKVVVRPDTGCPVTVICGMKPVLDPDTGKAFDFPDQEQFRTCLEVFGWDMTRDKDCVKIGGKFYSLEARGAALVVGKEEIPYEVVAGAIRTLYKIFGGTVTSTGHKLLDPCIGLIYGDSITTRRAEEILRRLAENGYAAANVVFGVGSYTYQCNTRDTFGFAVKATNSVVDGEEIMIFKDPKTDSKKKSAKGRLAVVRGEDGELKLYDQVSKTAQEEDDNLLQPFARDGKFLTRTTLEQIRTRLWG